LPAKIASGSKPKLPGVPIEAAAIFNRPEQRASDKVGGLRLKAVTAAEVLPIADRRCWRAGYLTALTHAPSWEQKFGKDAMALSDVGEDVFRKTARKVNRRATGIGTKADYDETWR
jgi:hypothetical protein